MPHAPLPSPTSDFILKGLGEILCPPTTTQRNRRHGGYDRTTGSEQAGLIAHQKKLRVLGVKRV